MALCTHERQLSPSLPREVNADAAAAAEEEEQAGRMEREMQRRRRSCRECGMSEVRKQQGHAKCRSQSRSLARSPVVQCQWAECVFKKEIIETQDCRWLAVEGERARVCVCVRVCV